MRIGGMSNHLTEDILAWQLLIVGPAIYGGLWASGRLLVPYQGPVAMEDEARRAVIISSLVGSLVLVTILVTGTANWMWITYEPQPQALPRARTG